MQWREPPEITCPKFHIHGSRDLLIPPAKARPTHIVQGAGHLMNLTHAEPVREFIREVQAKLARDGGCQ
jgi:pimeloyl-ACP methyl ester carboxylesterase